MERGKVLFSFMVRKPYYFGGAGAGDAVKEEEQILR
jgi:hypothetical protein